VNDAYYNLTPLRVKRLSPQDKEYSEKLIKLYEKWSITINDCHSMLNSENGDIRTLFADGGLLDQPSVELLHLFVVQSAYRKHLIEARKEAEKEHNKHK
jgi:hypothetical protein